MPEEFILPEVLQDEVKACLERLKPFPKNDEIALIRLAINQTTILKAIDYLLEREKRLIT